MAVSRTNAICSYSGGKDSALAIYKGIGLGFKPVSLLTTYNEEAQRSWFHGIPQEALDSVAQSMNVPLHLAKAGMGDEYASDFEAALTLLRDTRGAGSCIFGDIDIEEGRIWCSDRCYAVGIEPVFPLWQQSRKQLVFDLINNGFKCVITIVNTSKLSKRFLGQVLTEQVALEIESEGADICGENGEYHTFAFDGPIFSSPVKYELGALMTNGDSAILPVSLRQAQ
ncbi:MAG: adenine nucleotide alpha hydrolase [Eubacteriaceae bacterium]|nr:adenine nucleotide alpha hydrolase [Eubacteriaceae bacterium]